MPRCIAAQACSAVILSLNESGARRKVFIICEYLMFQILLTQI